MDTLWPIDEIDIDEEDVIRIKRNYEWTCNHYKCFFYLVLIIHVPLMYTLLVFFDPRLEVTLPWITKITTKSTMIIRILTAINEINVCLIVMAFDYFIINICGLINMQFEVLACRLKIILDKENRDAEEVENELIVCIKYHDFLHS